MAYNNNNLSDPRRREMLLRALRGEPVLALSREYGVSRTRIYESLERIKRDPEGDLIDAEIQVEFWERVIYNLQKAEVEDG